MPKKLHHEKYELLAPIIKALGHPLRLHLVEALEEGPCNVSCLARCTGAEISVVSRHLSQLVSAGIINKEKKGKEVCYHPLTPCVNRFLCCIENVLKKQTNAKIEKVQCATGCQCQCCKN